MQRLQDLLPFGSDASWLKGKLVHVADGSGADGAFLLHHFSSAWLGSASPAPDATRGAAAVAVGGAAPVGAPGAFL